jgi:hypothetical protein
LSATNVIGELLADATIPPIIAINMIVEMTTVNIMPSIDANMNLKNCFIN